VGRPFRQLSPSRAAAHSPVAFQPLNATSWRCFAHPCICGACSALPFCHPGTPHSLVAFICCQLAEADCNSVYPTLLECSAKFIASLAVPIMGGLVQAELTLINKLSSVLLFPLLQNLTCPSHVDGALTDACPPPDRFASVAVTTRLFVLGAYTKHVLDMTAGDVCPGGSSSVVAAPCCGTSVRANSMCRRYAHHPLFHDINLAICVLRCHVRCFCLSSVQHVCPCAAARHSPAHLTPASACSTGCAELASFMPLRPLYIETGSFLVAGHCHSPLGLQFQGC
jgi:hypothetical protein